MSSGLSPDFDTRYSDSIGVEKLSIALIGPDELRRQEMARALAEGREAEVHEFSSYPTSLDDVPRLLEQNFDVIIIDLDSEPGAALDLVESICSKGTATVMVYSAVADRERLVRCMRAGAREYLIPPYDQNTVAEALVRAAAILRPRPYPVKKTRGKLLVFFGAKGGSGVTTIACNFAIAMAQDSDQSTLLIDLGLPMGDAALNLGIAADYSTDSALLEADRLDGSFLQKLVAKHQSGVSLLAAPSKVPEVVSTTASIDKLAAVARLEFDYVIVDVGSRVDLMDTTLFKDASTIYLVTQAGISELRNSSRLISRFFHAGGPKLEIVINRFEPQVLGIGEEHIAKALNRPVQWKIPDDYDAVRQMQNTATPLALADSPISRQILEMASSVTGRPVPHGKKKGFNFIGLGRNNTEKASTTEKPLSILSPTPANGTKPVKAGVTPAIAWPAPDPITCGAALGDTQLNASASVPGTFVFTPSAGYMLPAGTHTLWVTFTPDDSAGHPVQAAVTIVVSRATPTIGWPEPEAISYGVALSSSQLKAEASVPGTLAYTPPPGELLDAGTHMLHVIFVPANEADYTPAEASVSIEVARATPAVAWAAPHPMPYGAALSDAQLNATASVPGRFEYAPGAGEVLGAGTHTLQAIFIPENSTNYAQTQATVSVSVARATPAIAWPQPDAIIYGNPLSSAQLSATASVPGTFEYIPGAGAVLAAGEHTPSVIFTPADRSSYTSVQAAVSLIVAKAMPVITWPSPDPIHCGAPLNAIQLNATASVPGTFVYSPAGGDVLGAGAHTLSVAFTPKDTTNYRAAQSAVSLAVTETAPTRITWPHPSAIRYGVALGAAQLNATASVPGTFVYSPAAGDVLAPGTHTLTVTLTPEDIEKYAPAQATVALVVEGLANIASLLTAATQIPFPQTGIANATDLWEGERDVATSGSSSTQEGQRETRTYKGAVYEKGEDGQWHLQRK